MEELTRRVKLIEVGNCLNGQVPCRTFCHVFLCNFICLFSEIGSNVACVCVCVCVYVFERKTVFLCVVVAILELAL